jgi:hypothetical protein
MPLPAQSIFVWRDSSLSIKKQAQILALTPVGEHVFSL